MMPYEYTKVKDPGLLTYLSLDIFDAQQRMLQVPSCGSPRCTAQNKQKEESCVSLMTLNACQTFQPSGNSISISKLDSSILLIAMQ